MLGTQDLGHLFFPHLSIPGPESTSTCCYGNRCQLLGTGFMEHYEIIIKHSKGTSTIIISVFEYRSSKKIKRLNLFALYKDKQVKVKDLIWCSFTIKLFLTSWPLDTCELFSVRHSWMILCELELIWNNMFRHQNVIILTALVLKCNKHHTLNHCLAQGLIFNWLKRLVFFIINKNRKCTHD